MRAWGGPESCGLDSDAEWSAQTGLYRDDGLAAAGPASEALTEQTALPDCYFRGGHACRIGVDSWYGRLLTWLPVLYG